MVSQVIPDEAFDAAAAAFAYKLAWCDRHSIDPRREDGLALRAALEAAAPHMACSRRHLIAAPKDESGW